MSKLVSIEVDLLNDFMHPEGKLYVSGAANIIPAVKKLSDALNRFGITRIGANDYHFKNDLELKRNGGPFPDHAMSYSRGKDIIKENRADSASILLYHRLLDDNFDWCEELIKHRIRNNPDANKFNVEKQEYNIFSNPAMKLLLKELGVTEAVVYGVATDFCVKAAVLGTQELGIQCYVVAEALRGIAEDSVKEAMEEMKAAGAQFILLTEALDMIEKNAEPEPEVPTEDNDIQCII